MGESKCMTNFVTYQVSYILCFHFHEFLLTEMISCQLQQGTSQIRLQQLPRSVSYAIIHLVSAQSGHLQLPYSIQNNQVLCQSWWSRLYKDYVYLAHIRWDQLHHLLSIQSYWYQDHQGQIQYHQVPFDNAQYVWNRLFLKSAIPTLHRVD